MEKDRVSYSGRGSKAVKYMNESRSRYEDEDVLKLFN